MILRLIPFVVAFALVGCVTAAPAGSMHDCKAMMAEMHADGGHAPAMTSDMMKDCPMMAGKAAPELPKDAPHGEGPEHQH